MLLQKGAREDAILALINTFLKDPTKRCGWCEESYDERFFPCCEQPFITTNAGIWQQFHKELQQRRNQQSNKFAATDDKSMRVKLTFPPTMLNFLTRSFKMMYDEDLFSKEYDTTWFAKKFGKYFAVAQEI